MSGHTHTHTYTHTHTHTYTHDNYYNPRCAHAHRGLITIIIVSATTLKCQIFETYNFRGLVFSKISLKQFSWIMDPLPSLRVF